MLAAACAGGMDLDRMGVDRSIVTSSVPANADPASADEIEIRRTVAGWPVVTAPPELAPWVNVATGSSGAIQLLSDQTDAEGLCRTFTATREAFDGVSLYSGRACTRGGPWAVLALEKS